MAALLPPLQIHITPTPLSSGIFQKEANALSGRRKRGKRDYPLPILFPVLGQARLGDKASSPRSRTFYLPGL